jgi:thiol-disulfide isomerase/thioredoxin
MRLRALLVLLAAHGCGASPGGTSARAVVPEVEVGGLARLEQAIAEHRGQPLLVNFWATWCAPCVAELPELLDTVAAHESGGLRILGVSYDLMLPGKQREATRALVHGYLEKRGWPLPTLLYDAPDYEAINARFDLPGAIPVTLAIDRAGSVVERLEGAGTKEHFERLARKALGP